MNLMNRIEKVMILGCSRCANEGIFYDDDSFFLAEKHFMDLGWTLEQSRVFCPQCNEERK